MAKRVFGRHIALAAMGILVVLAIGADGPKRTIKANGLEFEAPSAWKSVRPSSTFRLAQLAIEPVKPDTDAAELQVFAFPGGAGSVQDNVQRWQKQFIDDAGGTPKISTEKRKGKNTEVLYVEVAGRYVAAVRPGAAEHLDKPGYRLLGGIVDNPDTAYFLKLIGPDATVKAAKPAFEELIASMSVPKKQ
jgi:hypothetical protein